MWPFNKKQKTARIVSLLPPHIAEHKGLPAHAILGTLNGAHMDSLDGFVPNALFISFLHENLKQLLEEDPNFSEAARRQQNGWLYVYDARHRKNSQGLIPPEDIICGVRVDKELPVFSEYFANPKYELVSPERGIMHLPGGLQEKFIDRLMKSIV